MRTRVPVVGDLVALRQRLMIGCGRCGREVALEPAEAVRRLGAGATFARARARLRCSACGLRERDALWSIDVRASIEDHYRNLRELGHGVGPT